MKKQIQEKYDFCVVGGGFTGLCAAIAAARGGAKTVLIHDRPVLGGNGSSEIRMHICGASANMKKPELTEGGIIHELMLENKRLNDSYSFSIWDAVLFNAAKREKNLTLHLNTAMHEATAEAGRVKEISCYQLTTEKHIRISADFFADCTGNGTLATFVDAKYRTGSEGKEEYSEPHAPDAPNNKRMGNTLLFKATNKGKPVEFIPPVEIMHFTEDQLKYRKHSPEISKEILEKTTEEERRVMYSGYAQDYGYWWIEVPGEEEDIVGEYEKIRDQLVKAIYGVWNHIKNEGQHGADNLELQWVGMLPGTRESRRIECDYMLTENDILENRFFPDTVVCGGWDIDNHTGLFAYDEKPALTYPVDGSYGIPYRSYLVRDFENLFVGGRCMGASKLAMSSTRVMGTCAVGGQAIGTAAAQLCAKGAVNIRDIDINCLQNQLLCDDCYLPELKNSDEKDFARDASVRASSFAEGYEAENVTNGISRALGGSSNAWHSSKMKEDSPEWLSLSLKGVKEVSRVQITFDSNFNIEKKITISSTRQAQQVTGVPAELVKDFEIELILDGKCIEKRKVTQNYLRLVRVDFPPTRCDSVRINLISTNGVGEARIFELRIY